MDIAELREIARKYSAEDIERCITTQVETGENVCVKGMDTDAIIDELSKAEYVRKLTEEGMSLADALRELAHRMRLIQKGIR